MIRALPHILAGLACTLAAPASALSPLPACSGVVLGGIETWSSQSRGAGFVTYEGANTASKKAFAVLEHCKTGKALWVDTIWDTEGTVKGNLDDAIEALDVYLESDRKFTMKAIRRGLKNDGFKVKNVTMGRESCGCNVHFPELRGNRKKFAR